MRRWTVVVAVQLLLGGAAGVLAVQLGSPLSLTATLGLVVACGLAVSLYAGGRVSTAVTQAKRELGWIRGMAWVATVGYCAGAACLWDTLGFWDTYHAVIAWLVAGSYVAVQRSARAAPQLEWAKGVAWVWALIGSWIWVAAAYLEDRSVAFHAGLAMLVGVLVSWRLWFQLSGIEIQVANGCILLLIALPAVDWLFHAPRLRPVVAPADRLYSYSVARGDPTRFAVWWRQYLEAWNRMAQDIFMPDPEGKLPLRLRPNSQGYLMESRIVINGQGFRGPEIAPDKGDTYRIVALGESTTFGCTLEAGDRPWPELLEEWIRERLHPGRLVEVINAGVPAYNLEDNLGRFERELLALEPDLILSYHGYNGFAMLRSAVPRPAGSAPPTYTKRPSTFLAKLEFRLKSMRYEQRAPADPRPGIASREALIKSDYAEVYRKLVEVTRQWGIRMVLCTFSMAVDRGSAREVVEFYRPGFPSVYWQIGANEAHSELVRELARGDPEVGLVETGPGLDGRHEQYIDLVHLTQAGRRQLAENIFEGIRELLAEELAGR
jgi:lysophospholipase L1-like esterase